MGEQEFKRANTIDQSGTKIMAGMEKSRNEVAKLLAGIGDKASVDAIDEYLNEEEADPVLIAAVPGVLGKDPSERAGFDLAVFDGLKNLLEKKVAAMDVDCCGKGSPGRRPCGSGGSLRCLGLGQRQSH